MSKEIVELTDANFEDEVLKSEIPVLVDFWAEWCGPCKAIAPTIAEIAGEYAGKVKIGKLNVDNNRDSAMKFGIRSIPNLLIFNSGSVAHQIVGAVPKNNITTLLDEVI